MIVQNGSNGLPRRDFLKEAGGAAALLALGGRGLAAASPLALPQSLPKPGAADWTRFGYDLHNTRFNSREKTIGPKNVDKLKLKWSFDETGPVQSCPTVVGDTLFFGSWDGYYYCLDANTGKMKWKFDCKVPPFESGFHNMRSSAQYVDGRIYFGTGAVKVHCLDAATGKEIWQTQVENKPEHDPQLSSSVNVYKGMVFVGTSSGHAQIACLDAETGAVRWRFYVTGTVESGGGSIWTSPAIDEERDVVFNGTGSVKSWMPAGPALFTESMLANDLHTGELLWYYQAGKADTHDLDFSCHPMIFDAMHPTSAGVSRKCVGAGKKDGFYCFDRQTGERFWKAMLTNSSSNGGPLLNSTAAAYNKIFVVSNAITPKGGISVTAALNAYTGDIEWWIANAATHMAPVAVANKVFYQGFTNGNLEALDADTGRTLWQYKLPSAHRGGIAIANGTLYTSNGEVSLWGKATTDRHGLYAFSVDGK